MEVTVINNYDKYEAALKKELAAFKLVITADNETLARKERAAINAIRTRIDTERKSFNKIVDATYKKVLVNVDEKLAAYDKALDEVETTRKDKARQGIEAYYKSLEEETPLEKIFNPKWLNKDVSFQTIVNEIELALINLKEVKVEETVTVIAEAVEVTTYRLKDLTSEQKEKIEKLLEVLGVNWERL